MTEEQWRNSKRANTEIRHRRWNNERVGFGAKPTPTAHKKYGKTISSYRQNGQNPAKNLKPSFHFILVQNVSWAFKFMSLKETGLVIYLFIYLFFIQDIYYYNYKELLKKKIITKF